MTRIRITIAAIAVALALPLAAAAQHHGGMHHHKPAKKAAFDPIFAAYDEVRQALIRGSLPAVQDAAAVLERAARGARERNLATLAATLEDARDLTAAREAFADLSDEAILYRNRAAGARPAVAYCSMEKKSWLQPVGKIGNPYVDDSMRTCGEFLSDDEGSSGGDSHQH